MEFTSVMREIDGWGSPSTVTVFRQAVRHLLGPLVLTIVAMGNYGLDSKSDGAVRRFAGQMDSTQAPNSWGLLSVLVRDSCFTTVCLVFNGQFLLNRSASVLTVGERLRKCGISGCVIVLS